MEAYIQSYCGISNGCLFTDKANEQLTFAGLTDFFKEKYQAYNMDYPKFFKMDNLSKAALIALAAQAYTPAATDEYHRGIVLSNSNSSFDTDKKYEASRESIPSPALFVYTLPNICIGEIAIKYKCKGHSNFFISPQIDVPLLVNYTNHFISAGKMQECIVGWVDSVAENISCFIYHISTIQTEKKHTIENIHQIILDNKWKI